MSENANEKVIAVVGVGPGIGLAVARRFAREDYHVALIARRAEALEGYVASLQGAGLKASGYAADAGNETSLQHAFAQIIEKVGAPDVLVYNANSRGQTTPSTLEAGRLLDDFKVNVIGALVSVQQVLPHMRSAGHGTIILTGGGLALAPNPQYASLAVGKAGLRNLAYSLGAEVEAQGIHVATVTIRGYVQPGTHFDPDKIADVYWRLHMQPSGQQEREIVYE